MAERKIDSLVMQNNNDWLGGYVRWFTDTPLSNGYPRSVIFPAADLITVVDMGGRGARRKLDGSDEVNRGVGEMIFTPASPASPIPTNTRPSSSPRSPSGAA